MTSSAQLEREAEQTRSQLVQTLNELRERITPGQLMDQVVDYAKDNGSGEFVRNLGHQMSANPLPVCLMGAGMAWLMLSGRRGSVPAGPGATRFGEAAYDTRERLAGTAKNTADSARDAARETRDTAESSVRDFNARASDAASSVSETASSAYAAGKEQAAAVGDAVADGYDRMTDAASRTGSRILQGTSSATQQTAQVTRNLLQFCAEQPLVLAGLGLAIGAAFGATLPETETENQLMGESSDTLKGRAQEFAQEQYAKGEEVARTAAQAVKATAREATEPAASELTVGKEHREASLVPDASGRDSGDPQEGAAEQRHGFVK